MCSNVQMVYFLPWVATVLILYISEHNTAGNVIAYFLLNWKSVLKMDRNI